MEPAALAIAIQPLVVNPGHEERVAHAAYRVGAITRHVAQGSYTSPERHEEFKAELLSHCLTLRRAGRKDVALAALQILRGMN